MLNCNFEDPLKIATVKGTCLINNNPCLTDTQRGWCQLGCFNMSWWGLLQVKYIFFLVVNMTYVSQTLNMKPCRKPRRSFVPMRVIHDVSWSGLRWGFHHQGVKGASLSKNRWKNTLCKANIAHHNIIAPANGWLGDYCHFGFRPIFRGELLVSWLAMTHVLRIQQSTFHTSSDPGPGVNVPRTCHEIINPSWRVRGRASTRRGWANGIRWDMSLSPGIL